MATVTPITQTEQELVEAAKRDAAAFKPLYEQHYKTIFLFVLRRIGDKERTADITSQVFLKVLQALPKYTYTGVPFVAWLYRIAINEVNLFFRQQKHDRLVSLDTDQLTHLHEELLNDLSLEHLHDRLPALLQKLNEQELHLIELRFFEQLSFKEIAKIFELTEVHAKVKVYRILVKLKKHFRDEKQN